MTDLIYGGNRNGSITKEEAISRFNQYYEGRAKSAIGRFRAKLFDMMYQKKPTRTFRPNEPGSEKYMLEEGPRTFDIVGVDSFDEGTEFTVHGEDTGDKYTSKGATYKKDDDAEENIYGPRLEDDKLYSTHFREVYESRKQLEDDDNASLKNKNLVDIYWTKYKQGGIERKNKKDKGTMKPYLFGAFLPGAPKCVLNTNNVDEISYESSGALLSDSEVQKQHEFLLRLNIIYNSEEGYRFNKKYSNVKVIKVIVSVSDDEDVFYYRVNDGKALNEDCSEDNVSFFKLFELFSYELEDIDNALIHRCDDKVQSELSVRSDEEESVDDIISESNLFEERNLNLQSLDDEESDEGESGEEEESDDEEESDGKEEPSLSQQSSSLEESIRSSTSEMDKSSLEDMDDASHSEQDRNKSVVGDEEELTIDDLDSEADYMDDEEEYDEEEDDEMTKGQAEVFSGLDANLQQLPGMEEAIKDLDI